MFGEPEYLKAVSDINFNISKIEMIGLACQNGCGKSTVGELILGLQTPISGDIRFNGEDITKLNKKQMKGFRSNCQVVF